MERLSDRVARSLAFLVLFAGLVALCLFAMLPALSASVPGWSDKELSQPISGMTRTDLAVDGRWVVYVDQITCDIVIYDLSTGALRSTPAEIYYDSVSSMAGGWVAWHDFGTNMVHVENCGTGQQSVMSTGSNVGRGPVVSEGRVFWVTIVEDPLTADPYDKYWSLQCYDVSTGSVASFDTPIDTGQEVIRELHASGGWAVWSQVIWTGPQAGQSEVCAWNSDAGTVVNLSARQGTDETPRISGEWVVWVGNDGNDDEVFLQNVTGGTWRQLTNNSLDDAAPRIQGDHVVWVGSPGLYLYTISSGTQTCITSGAASRPDLGGDWVVWEEGSEVWVYDISDATSTVITERLASGGWSGFPATDGKTVVYVDNSMGVHVAERSMVTTSSSTTSSTASSSTTTSSTTATSSTSTTLSGGQRFSDVPPSHPYYTAINGMAAAGVIGGYTDGRFGPADPVMRQQFAKMIVGTMGFPCSEADICPFSDVIIGGPSTLYPDNYVAVAAAFGITKGTGAGRFGPYLNITRAQVITMVVRAAQQYTNGLGAPSTTYYQTGIFAAFNDPTHGTNVQLAEANGLLAGIQGSGDPGVWIWGSATRGEVAQILWNLSGVPGLAG